MQNECDKLPTNNSNLAHYGTFTKTNALELYPLIEFLDEESTLTMRMVNKDFKQYIDRNRYAFWSRTQNKALIKPISENGFSSIGVALKELSGPWNNAEYSKLWILLISSLIMFILVFGMSGLSLFMLYHKFDYTPKDIAITLIQNFPLLFICGGPALLMFAVSGKKLLKRDDYHLYFSCDKNGFLPKNILLGNEADRIHLFEEMCHFLSKQGAAPASYHQLSVELDKLNMKQLYQAAKENRRLQKSLKLLTKVNYYVNHDSNFLSKIAFILFLTKVENNINKSKFLMLAWHHATLKETQSQFTMLLNNPKHSQLLKQTLDYVHRQYLCELNETSHMAIFKSTLVLLNSKITLINNRVCLEIFLKSFESLGTQDKTQLRQDDRLEELLISFAMKNEKPFQDAVGKSRPLVLFLKELNSNAINAHLEKATRSSSLKPS